MTTPDQTRGAVEARICDSLREALFVVLENRELELSLDLRKRVLECRDLNQLECCFARALVATSGEEAVLDGLNDTAPIQTGMSSGERLYHAGEVVGEVQGIRESLLDAVKATGLVLARDDSERIHTCRSVKRLCRWRSNVVQATSAADIFRDSPLT